MNVLNLVLSVAVAAGHPQLDPQSASSFFNFPTRSGSSVEAELNSVSVVSDDVSAGGSRSGGRSGDDGPLMPYSFNYDASDADSQVYHSRQEQSDGETVTGSYSYVDPTGALIIVNYRAGVMGYTETRERQENYLEIRPVTRTSSSTSSSSTSSSSTITSGAGSNRFASSTSGGGQQTTTTLKKKKTIDQNALIAKIIAALQPQLSSIVDESIDEFETVTEEKFVTVEKLPTITSTFEFNEQQQRQF